jgi:hypothetical protein
MGRTQTHQQKNGGRHTLRASKIHADSRTQRERTRGDAERVALAEELETIDAILSENYDGLLNYKAESGE